MRNPRITRHAIERFIERVDHTASPSAAAQRIGAMVQAGRVRPNPRWWTGSRPEPGTMFIYSAAEAQVCLLATRDAVVTVVSRELCAATRRHRDSGGGRTSHVPYSRGRIDPLAWMDLEAAA